MDISSLFEKVVTRRRVGWGYGTGRYEVLWSNWVLCSDGWNTWIEEVEGDEEVMVEGENDIMCK